MSDLYGGLTAYGQFVVYEKVWDAQKGKFNKKPCDIAGSRFDNSTNTKFNHLDPANWLPYDQARIAADLLGDNYDVGFVFSKDDPFFFLDIDKCLVDGQWSPIVNELCALFPGAYVEVSMSGTGIHIVGSSAQYEHSCRNKDHSLEFYTDSRFMALGNSETARGSVFTHHDAAVQLLISKYFDPTDTITGTQAQRDSSWTTTHDPRANPIMNDDVLIAKALKSSSAASVFGGGSRATFAELWNGTDSLGQYFPPDNPNDPFDRSFADSALATHLMFWTGGDCERVERLMRRSALNRDKYDRRGDNYLQRTIMGAKATHDSGGAEYYSMRDEVIELVPPGDDAIDLAEEIETKMTQFVTSQLKGTPAEQTVVKFNINVVALDQIITRTFWSGTKSKLFVLTDDNVLNMYVEKDMLRIVEKYFGTLIDNAEVEHYAALIDSMECSKIDDEKLVKALNGIPHNIITDHLKMKNQRDKLRSTVDMFAKRPRMEWFSDSVTNVYVWRPLPKMKEPDPVIINDYKQHFPMVDNLLRQIVAARFASDRKKCFTWLKADSDWGKGIFTSVLEELGLLVELSVKETEKAFEGAPMAKDGSLFIHAFVVCFNEFKMVKSELKQIENKLPISPKNQLMQMVDIYHKLFTSAESVDSLVGEAGVEDQFANRFSYIEGNGSISVRHVFTTEGKFKYYNAVKSYIANFINTEVNRYIALGKDGSKIEADKFVESFHHEYGIGRTFERISENMPDLVAAFKSWVINKYAAPMPGTETHLYRDENFYYLTSASKIFGDWLDETASRSERFTLGKKKNEVIGMLGVEDRPRFNGKQLRAIKFSI
ncbi:putative primase [Vibrio phage vB_VchM-138]|uniref:Putative primase n=1 Tax=Vibrio phage Rostov M3 TaxID=2660724 RepID=A0A5Q2WDT8_9CAUD|nr:DNA primase [Vibrio phage vB_VchM-138]AFC22698.1 putative primase [Vibrio phage vB_VchM-138]QGH75014.1 putative primase [Vibrio phage Rostov M3]